MSRYPIELVDAAKDRYGQPMVCSGCSHSAAGMPFPGMPSGERPCFFCERNVDREEWCKEHLSACTGLVKIVGQLGEVRCCHPAHGKWYGGSDAHQSPMDCYYSSDMSRQIHIWQGGSKDLILFG